MRVLSHVVLAAAELDDPHLIALAVRLNGRGDLPALYEGRAELDVAALTDDQHLVEFDRCARVGQSFSIRSTLPSATRYCLPPVAMTANMTEYS